MSDTPATDVIRDRLSLICADSLDVPAVYRDGRSALEVQTREMGQVSGWFADCRDALDRLEELQRAAVAYLEERPDVYRYRALAAAVARTKGTTP